MSVFVILVTLWILVAGDGCGALARRAKLTQRRAEQIRKRLKHDWVHATREPVLKKRASPFLNSKSEKFLVNGSALPDIDFDVGQSFAGVLPNSDHPDESRKLYFWFFPSSNEAAQKEITSWLQGGPGGASTVDLLLENGPLLWQPGTAKPPRNTFSRNVSQRFW